MNELFSLNYELRDFVLGFSPKKVLISPTGSAENAQSKYNLARIHDRDTNALYSSSKPRDDHPITHYFHSNLTSKYQELDLIYKIKDLYRLLDIYAEEGSGGLGKLAFLSKSSLTDRML